MPSSVTLAVRKGACGCDVCALETPERHHSCGAVLKSADSFCQGCGTDLRPGRTIKRAAVVSDDDSEAEPATGGASTWAHTRLQLLADVVSHQKNIPLQKAMEEVISTDEGRKLYAAHRRETSVTVHR